MGGLEKASVLLLDAAWIAIEEITPKSALKELISGSVVAIFAHKSGESWNYEPMTWDRWLDEAENGTSEDFVRTPRLTVYVPTIVMCTKFVQFKPRISKPRVNRRNARELYGDRCAYTQKYLGGRGNLDHVVAKANGGIHDWSKVVYSDPELNPRKRDLTLEEAGLPAPQIKQVTTVPKFARIGQKNFRPEWVPFVFK